MNEALLSSKKALSLVEVGPMSRKKTVRKYRNT